jgi:hypothetical protein
LEDAVKVVGGSLPFPVLLAKPRGMQIAEYRRVLFGHCDIK